MCHALALLEWVISFASLEQVVGPLHPRSTSHVCLSQCHMGRPRRQAARWLLHASVSLFVK